MADFPLGLRDNLYRWDEFPVWNSGSPPNTLLSQPQSGDACLTADGHCLTVPFAAQGAVFFPYSYRGAGFTSDSSGTARLFKVQPYGWSDSGGGDPAQHVEYLQQEINSIHTVWPSTRIALVGHSYGGLVAEQWWEKYWLSSPDGEGVTYVFTLDSPVNGFEPGDVFLAYLTRFYSDPILRLWHVAWEQRIPRDKILIATDQAKASTLRTIGTADDGTYTTLDPHFEGLGSQVLGFPNGRTWLATVPPSYVSPCHASQDIDGINGHDTVKVCTQVIDYIAGLVGVQ
jgi:pimeloyl-ACP methyl ester carboxylesterase